MLKLKRKHGRRRASFRTQRSGSVSQCHPLRRYGARAVIATFSRPVDVERGESVAEIETVTEVPEGELKDYALMIDIDTDLL